MAGTSRSDQQLFGFRGIFSVHRCIQKIYINSTYIQTYICIRFTRSVRGVMVKPFPILRVFGACFLPAIKSSPCSWQGCHRRRLLHTKVQARLEGAKAATEWAAFGEAAGEVRGSRITFLYPALMNTLIFLWARCWYGVPADNGEDPRNDAGCPAVLTDRGTSVSFTFHRKVKKQRFGSRTVRQAHRHYPGRSTVTGCRPDSAHGPRTYN